MSTTRPCATQSDQVLMAVSADESRLPSSWERAARDLGLEIVAPFELEVASGTCIRVPLLVRYFGGHEGMLVLSDYSVVVAWIDEITEAGYGFSVMSEPDTERQYGREEVIEILKDWGWAGPDSERPVWL